MEQEKKNKQAEAEIETASEPEKVEVCEAESKDKKLANEYLNMARVIQADFDNYRKRTAESIRQAKQDGMISAVEVILPSLDVFKKAKEIIKDKDALKGVEMVESSIVSSLKSLGVEKIAAEGEMFDPKKHCALAVYHDNSKPDGFIKEEFQTGFRFGEKVIRYSQVLVNKVKEGN